MNTGDAPGIGTGDQPDLRTTAGKIADLERRRREAIKINGSRQERSQRPKGKLTARERIDKLLDPASFTELGEFARHRGTAFRMADNRPYGDGVITGFGTIDGRQVCVFSQDFSTYGGALGEVSCEKIVKIMDLALSTGCPIIGINDGGGARIQEGVAALGRYGEIFYRNVAGSGIVPQVSLIMGPCAGGAAYSPAMTDFTLMVDQTSHMFVTGPDVIKTVTGEEISQEQLGGARTHNVKSGVAHYLALDEEDCLAFTCDLLSYLPPNNLDEAPVLHGDQCQELGVTRADTELDTLIPDSAGVAYDMHTVIEHVLDHGRFLEIHGDFARNIVVGFGRVDGRSVGVVANQPMHLAGTLDIDAAEKATRFVRTCDAFSIPLLTIADVPGYLPGTSQEWGGIIRRGAKLNYAYAEATVPKVAVITRKAIGGSYGVMGSKHLGGDINLAWPTAQIAVMGAEGAVNVLYRREIAAADGLTEQAAVRRLRAAEYEEILLNPYAAAERGYIDAVIRPAETRGQVIRALRTLRTKRRTPPARMHGNIPM